MRKLSSTKNPAVHFLLAYLSVSVLISLTLGLFDTVSEAKCEFEDANVTWRNTLEYSPSDVKAMAWYKGKGSLIATWLEGKGFMEYPPYIGRLMQIGATGITIRTANRSDSGIYFLSLTLASVDHKLEAATYLEVKVAPSTLCKPRITQEGPFIKADLPQEGCGIPHLRTNWKYNNVTITYENSSTFLDMRTNPEPGEYVACAEGESATCYKGNISDLCSTHTIPSSDHGSTPGDELHAVVIPVLVLIAFAAILLVLVLCIYTIRCTKPSGGHAERTVEEENISGEEQNKSNDINVQSYFDEQMIETLENAARSSEKKIDTYRMELSDIAKYLKEHYQHLMNVPLSPTGEGDDYVNISDLYVNITFAKVEITDLNNEKRDATSCSQSENEPLIHKDQVPRKNKKSFCPILIFGDCGSGKSSWCKHLVQCWLQGVDIKDENMGLNLPDLRKIKILLYLPLQFSDRGIFLKELLKKHLFQKTHCYLELVMNYVTTNAHEVLLVMDGLDIIKENIMPILDILNNKHMSLSTVIITSRPASLKLLQDHCDAKMEQMMLFRVCKMNIEDSKSYASNVLKTINKLQGTKFNIAHFWRFTEQLHVNDLLMLPYICLILLHVWMKNKNCFIGMTDIMFDIIRYYLHRATSDQKRKECIDDASCRKTINVQNGMTKLNKWNIQMEQSYLLHALSRIAAEIFQYEIEKEPMKLNVPHIYPITDGDLQRICETGLLTEPLSLSAKKSISTMSFPDRLISEFFVSMFVVLQEGEECDFVLPYRTASVSTTIIIHILYELSDTLTKDIIQKAIKTFGKENTNTKGEERCNYLNDKIRFCITSKDESPVLWLHWHMNNLALYATKLLFMSTALQCIQNITSLELTNDETNENLVFQLPFLPVLKSLTLDMNKCTLLLCKGWDNRVPCKLEQVVIRSVNISIGTLSLLIKSLSFCAGLEKLEVFPSVVWTDDDINCENKPDLDTYSWNKLSKHIENNKKLKLLELTNLILPGVVGTLLSRLNRYQNLENLKLKNVSNITQETNSSDTENADADRPYSKVNLTNMYLERLKLLESPLDFLFDVAIKGKPIEHNINVLYISALEMPEKSWKTLGNQIGNLRLTELHLSSVNPGDSLQTLLDGIGESKTVDSLYLRKIGKVKMIASFSFLAKMKTLLQFKLNDVKLDGSSSRSLFKEICECKQLHNLSLCNIDAEEIPETLSSVQTLTKLSVLTFDRVTITGGSQSLIDILNAFIKCETLLQIQVSKEHAASIPSNISSAIQVVYLDKY
ncbi:hypothetical protein ACJMK2_042256 [Sinanodonta woodiana]|uniref:NACHT domain-containing protein n=1 Tax=Sinanodonta woodiana TaxID=1069815 RepID=A0ABD3W9T3_SINWO